MIRQLNPAQAQPARIVEIAPNKFVQLDLNLPPPEMVLCDVVPIPGHAGHFKLSPRSWERLVRVTPELLDRLGVDRMTLLRLIRSGFVDGARVVPRAYVVNLVSFFAHMKKCAENPDYWENPRILSEYKTAY